MDIYASENVIITTKKKDVELVPRYNQTECLIFLNEDDGGDSGGPTLGSNVDGATAVSSSIRHSRMAAAERCGSCAVQLPAGRLHGKQLLVRLMSPLHC